MKTITERLAAIQSRLNAPKGQTNTFGGYKYRSCEDILTAVKPLLDGLVITISDEVTSVCDRVYVRATATITDGENSISTSGFAREAPTKKGMDDSQITGSASSYARKYALNGLLLIDDSKDADAMDNREHAMPSSPVAATLNDEQIAAIEALADEVNVPIAKVLAFAKTKTLKDVPLLAYAPIIAKLEEKRKA